VKHVADVNTKDNIAGQSVLMHTARVDNFEIVKLLIRKDGDDTSEVIVCSSISCC
jgi:ankyrin repeat protein